MKLSDYVFTFLADRGVRHVFLVTGGGAMHLNDSLRKETRITPICQHHEQACAMAAEGYARITGTPGVVSVTTGPGGINALNGVFGAWTDSIPMLVISGQVKRETCMAFHDVPGLRQLGDQEADILSMVKGITKYAALVRTPEEIRYQMEKAWHLCQTGRQGPCWIDIPVDIQSAQVDAATLKGFAPAPLAMPGEGGGLAALCSQVIERIREARRPVLMVGTGIRLAGALDVFERVARCLQVPVATTWTAIDVLDSDAPLFCGRPGTVGDRAGNFTVQNADVVVVLGSRLNIRQVSYNWSSFARAAFKIQVDADEAELRKPTVRPDLPVHANLKVFLEEMERQLSKGWNPPEQHSRWLAWCKERTRRYPVVLPRHRMLKGDRINPYHFVETLFSLLGPDDVVVCGNGSACVVTFQAARVQRGQRIFCNSGSASMGYDLPAALGAAVASGGKRVVCLAGDGSLQMNIQELQTLSSLGLPVKLFVLNNGGYLSMRITQRGFFGALIGESPSSGVGFPDFVQVARAYGLPADTLGGERFEAGLQRALDEQGPFVCEVLLDPDQEFEPKLTSRQMNDGRLVSSPLEDPSPFLSREELRENMLIPLVEE